MHVYNERDKLSSLFGEFLFWNLEFKLSLFNSKASWFKYEYIELSAPLLEKTPNHR
jgi:hypothetical protein